MDWSSCKILVTGGASFIGSHLCDLLIEEKAARIRVVDDLSSGVLSNIQKHVDDGRIEFIQGDLLHQDVAEEAVRGIDVVFHLAAIHGGRGYVDLHQAMCAQNLALDGILIKAAREAGVDRFLFASSGCVYPNHIQADVNEELYLSEDMVGPPYAADNMYGWAKLMTEMTLKHSYEDLGHGLRRARRREPRGHGDDRSGIHRPRPVRSLGRRDTDPQLDVRWRYSVGYGPGG
jgi:nucleoside-diphosphate-sugar epimerase